MQAISSSYKDTDGFVFEHQNKVYRYVNNKYDKHYQTLMHSGLYQNLIQKKQLIPHQEIEDIRSFNFSEGKILFPTQIPFISYPYEWSFDMWKDAAILTLQIAQQALEKNMVLKDATPFNIQFLDGKPIFIDTLSFENYNEGLPWVAYRQFCECFLAPLLLMQYCHADMAKIFTIYPNGIPLNILSTLLPKKAKWNVNNFLHIYLQSKLSVKRESPNEVRHQFSKQKLSTLFHGLFNYVEKIQVKKSKTVWDNYYTNTILGKDYLLAKTELVKTFMQPITYTSVLDLGANDGHFSLLLAEQNKKIIALDGDENCINNLYLFCKKENQTNILPLICNLVSPSPSIGWANAERSSITSRLCADVAMALALVHHLAIANNLPFSKIAEWLSKISNYLLIEFVPKSDEKVKLLLQNREDIFDQYSLKDFEDVFQKYFTILNQETVENTNRVLFLMKRNDTIA